MSLADEHDTDFKFFRNLKVVPISGISSTSISDWKTMSYLLNHIAVELCIQST